MDRIYKKVYVTKKAEDSIKNSHPWVYKGEIIKEDNGIQNGDIIDIYSLKDSYLGSAFYNSNSKIILRIISRNANDKFDRDFFKRRIRYAINYRLMVMNDMDSVRLIYGEADELPGLTVDKFSNIIVVQILSLGIDIRRDMILPLLKEVLEEKNININGIYLRNDVDIRLKEGLKEENGWFYKEEGISNEVIIRENNLKYYVDFVNGQKTGYFLDQKLNRLIVSSLSKDKTVLDCCTHTGSFAMNAKLGMAKRVVASDISSKALDDAKRNFKLNQLDIEIIESDVFDLLEKISKEKKKEYDMIILDPPPFTKSRKTINKALKGYEEINYLAMKALPRGGILVTASCSHFANREMFLNAIHKASVRANVKLKEIISMGASPDHPVLVGVEETEYLQFFIFQVF